MDERNGCGISFTGALFLLLLGLKLGHVIDWSWWWVTSPLWLPGAILLAFLGLAFLAGSFEVLHEARLERRYERERLERQRMARCADLANYDEWGKPREH
jgi:hypothetical protein